MDRPVEWLCDGGGANKTDVLYICPRLLAYGALPAALAALTVVGNVLVIAAVVFNAKLRRRHTSILIANLALADLLVGE
jgi:hypothetical protein